MIGDDIDMMDSDTAKEELQKVKAKMDRTVGKKVTGFMKGLFNKASQKVKSSIYRRNTKNRNDHGRQRSEYLSDNKIHLKDDPEDDLRGSVYR